MSEVLSTTQHSGFHVRHMQVSLDEGREIDPRQVQQTNTKCESSSFDSESFPKLLVLLDKMHTGM